jgi:hypothetical protein
VAVSANPTTTEHHIRERHLLMTSTLDTSTSPGTPDTTTAAPPATDTATSSTGCPNARGEAVFLTAETYTLTARQIVLALAAHLARFGDTLHVQVVDPLCAIDAVMRFDGADLTGWTVNRTPTEVAAVRARADVIARDYFGRQFPAVPW